MEPAQTTLGEAVRRGPERPETAESNAPADPRDEELAALRAREQQLLLDMTDADEQIAALTRLLAEGRDREVALKAQAQQAQAPRDSAEALALRAEVRRLRAELTELEERETRAAARAAEQQAVIDALGRERAALRAEAGSLRARLELLATADVRLRQLGQEVDELRRENDWMERELARFGLARQRARSPLSR
jgi:chromosome segregation ATPase